MCKKVLLISLVLMGVVSNYSAQFSYEVGIKTGVANYLGDIGGKDLPRQGLFLDMHINQSRLAGSIFTRLKYNKKFMFSQEFGYMKIQDADKYSTYIPRRTRNLNFRNRLIESSTRAEYTIWYDNDVSNRGFYNPDFKLYIFTGLSVFYSNPQAQLVYDPADSLLTEQEAAGLTPGDFVDDTWYNLRQYRTEGATYSAVGIAIPAGVGFYLTFNKTFRLGYEICWRKTFTDYLDDVSTLYNKPDPEDTKTYPIALALQSQTYEELFEEQNELLLSEASNPIYLDIYNSGALMSINDFRYQPGNEELEGGVQSPRGLHDPNNPLVKTDNYLTMQITASMVIKTKSKFWRSKYGWVKNRSSVKRSRGKF